MPDRIPPLRTGHALRLLEGSAQYFPALVSAIDAARQEVWLETYIFDFTGASAEVAWALERAARRGVSVRVVVDGFGTVEPAEVWRHRLVGAGVEWRVFAPVGRFGVLTPASWRRLHRKLCVVDERVAFCGGINILDDLHDPNHGPLPAPRLDFAVEVTGPLVAQVREAMLRLWQRMRAFDELRRGGLAGALTSLRASRVADVLPRMAPASGPGSRAALVLRDNFRHRANIERAYLRAIGRARSEVIIANAYFVPGRRMRKALAEANRRGVRVVLLLQGRYEYFMQYYAARPIYGALLRAGAEIHEYSASFLHAKVAVIDGRWATVGSSNIDPLSLLLAREANVLIEDEPFAQALRTRLLHAVEQGQAMEPAQFAERPLRERLLEHVALALMRIALAIEGKRTYW